MPDPSDSSPLSSGAPLAAKRYRECARVLREATECLDRAALCNSSHASEVLLSRGLLLILRTHAVWLGREAPCDLAVAWAQREHDPDGAALFQGLPVERIGLWVEHASGHPVESQNDLDAVGQAIRRLARRTSRELRRRAPKGFKVARIAFLCAVVAAVFIASQWQGWLAEHRGDGFLVTHYSDADLTQKVCRTREAVLFRDYGDEGPAFRVPRDHFSSRWEGSLTIPETGTYTFFSQSKGSLRMWINDTLVLDQSELQEWAGSGRHGERALPAGEHRLKLEYAHGTGEAALRVRWAGGSVPPNTIIGVPYVHAHR